MRTLVLCLLAIGLFAESASAAIVFTLTQNAATPGPITLGTTAVFDVHISSNTGTINNLAGIDFVIDANDQPLLLGNSVTAGRFVSGTSDFFPLAAGSFAFAFPTSTQQFAASSANALTLTGTPTKVASLTLNTTGATPGNYLMGLTNLGATDPQFGNIGVVGPAARLQYSIVSAIPEPSSLVLVLAAGAIGRAFLLRRRKSVPVK